MNRTVIPVSVVLLSLPFVTACWVEEFQPPSAGTSIQLQRRDILEYVTSDKRKEGQHCRVLIGGILDVEGADEQGVFVRYNTPRRGTVPSDEECSTGSILHLNPRWWTRLSEDSANEVRRQQSLEQRLQKFRSSDNG